MRFLSIQRVALGLLLTASLGAVVACSRSTEDAERRGLVTEPEVAVPESVRELDETAAERRARSEAELARDEEQRFDEAEAPARNPVPAPER